MSRKAALHSEWHLGLAVVVVGVALAIPVLSLLWASAERPSAPISRRGVHHGASYRIEVPAGWHGKLVVFAHGYEGEGSGQGSVHTSPLGTYLTRQGYAWAASGYRSRGYRPDWFVADTLALRELFVREIGPPHWTIIHGVSMMGGHGTIASLELYPGVYQGALIECGIIDGVSLGDLHYAWRAAAEYLSGCAGRRSCTSRTFRGNDIRDHYPHSVELHVRDLLYCTVYGFTRATNDVGLVTLPNGQHLAITVFVAD